MLLNARQYRNHSLAQLLGSGNPVKAADLLTELRCSEPTLSRSLRDLRRQFSAEIKYSKSSHSYQLTSPGTLSRKILTQINAALARHDALLAAQREKSVSLSKAKKKAVSLSLPVKTIRKIDRAALKMTLNRSDTIELLVEHFIDVLVSEHGATPVIK
ncbi:tellurium resistance protein TerW [Affinibrenneria salicis]|uniref:Tellurium resistance protein TerW n=1 Tax=Affinibrenneria salicis TaxID=2590031 RepID=A0A5J5G0U6_9GAMM|nr:tellurium resistance protein TerW [Affinibrenneria salicis]